MLDAYAKPGSESMPEGAVKRKASKQASNEASKASNLVRSKRVTGAPNRCRGPAAHIRGGESRRQKKAESRLTA